MISNYAKITTLKCFDTSVPLTVRVKRTYIIYSYVDISKPPPPPNPPNPPQKTTTNNQTNKQKSEEKKDC